MVQGEREVNTKVHLFEAGPPGSERDVHFIFSTEGRHPADVSRRMTRCDVHVKKITRAARWRLKGEARTAAEEQLTGCCHETTQTSSLAGYKGKEENLGRPHLRRVCIFIQFLTRHLQICVFFVMVTLWHISHQLQHTSMLSCI